MNARTYLFVPGDRPERFAKALSSGADAVVFDLEDAVAPDRKAAARDSVAAGLQAVDAAQRERIVVRINDQATPWWADDLRMVADAGVAQLMLPKAETADHVASMRAVVPAVRLLALIESARGVANVEVVAAAKGVVRLVFGTLDFALDLDIDIGRDPAGLAYAAGRIAIASRAAALAAPVAGVTPEIGDEARLLADLAWARGHGFGAKLCIHPQQVAPIHAALRPTDSELDWARRVVAAAQQQGGAVQVDGRMVDRPVLQRARGLLARGNR